MRSSIVNKQNLNISVNHNQKLYMTKSNVLQGKQPVQRIKSLDDRALIIIIFIN